MSNNPKCLAADKCSDAPATVANAAAKPVPLGPLWPGGYPVYYSRGDDPVLCSDCANGGNRSAADTNPGSPWHLHIHWTGPALRCTHCGVKIGGS